VRLTCVSDRKMLIVLQLYAAVSVNFVCVKRVLAFVRNHLLLQREQQAAKRAAGCKKSSKLNARSAIFVANRRTLQ